MRTLDEIANTPVGQLTEAEVDLLEPKQREWAKRVRTQLAREAACPGHEPTGTSTQTGWHSLKCIHCGKDMSYDSGD